MGAGRPGRRRLLATVLGATALEATALLGQAPAALGSLPPGPTPTTAPSVIGTAAAGKRLTGVSGVWTGSGGIEYRFQWNRCNAAGADCLSIGGATSPTYTLVAKDVGKTVGLSVHATDSTGTAIAYASLVGPVAAARPPLEVTLQPVVEGAPMVGRTLKVTPGSWSPMVATFTYAWERCNANGRVCAPIPGASTSSHLVTAADLGHALLALVQATNRTTVQNTFSEATPAVVARSVSGPASLTPAQATGTVSVGSQLIAATGRWQGVGSVTFAFQWSRCDLLGRRCAAIRGATGATYRVGALDAGLAIGLRLRASDLTGTSVAIASLVGPVAAAGSLAALAPPTVSGTPTVGSSLTVSTGSWSATPESYRYIWLRCDVGQRFCSEVGGADAATYTLTSADLGHVLVAEVEASAGGKSQSALSSSSAPIG